MPRISNDAGYILPSVFLCLLSLSVVLSASWMLASGLQRFASSQKDIFIREFPRIERIDDETH